VAGAVTGLIVMANIPTSYWLPSEKASIEYLEETYLQNIAKDEKDRKKYKASDLWKDNGAVVMVVRRPG